MKKILYSTFFCFVLSVQFANAAGLENSILYMKTVRDCKAIDLNHWSHPARTVLQKAGVILLGVQLCNGSKYPVFTVNFKYDPEGQTESYFDPLYVKMGIANGYYPFSFVDQQDKDIINVNYSRDHRLKIDYEQF